MPTSLPKAPPHAVDVHVGRKVAETRIGLGYNQSDLGRALNLTFQQVQKYEKGTNRISASKLWLMAAFLQKDIGYFFDGLDPHIDQSQSTSSDGPVFQPTRSSLEIAKLAPSLSTSQQKLVLELINSLRGGKAA